MSKSRRMTILVLVDTVLAFSSMFAAYLLRFDLKLPAGRGKEILIEAVCYSAAIVATCWLNRIYKRVWRFAGVNDIASIGLAAVMGSSLFFGLYQFGDWLNEWGTTIPRSVFLLSGIFAALGILTSRMTWRAVRGGFRSAPPRTRKALIVGAGDAGLMVVRELSQRSGDVQAVGFVDDDRNKKGLVLFGIPVLGNRNDIPSLVNRRDITDIILAVPSAPKDQVRDILKICRATNRQIKIIPRLADLIDGKVSISSMRDVRIEDLLGRDPVKLDASSVGEYLAHKTILVTGAGGSIGSELCRQVALHNPARLILLGHGENSIYQIEYELRMKYPELPTNAVIADIQDKLRLQGVFDEFRPHVVFHAAAHKHVPMMEDNPLEAVKNNVFGTHNVADCAHLCKAERLIMISTDKAVNPTNVMGASKRVAEMIVQNYGRNSMTKYAVVRFGNVLGSRGSVIPLFKKQIEQGGPVTVTHPDMTRYFMTIPEAVQLVLHAGTMADDGEVFVLDMGNPVKIVDLAKDLIRLSGYEPGRDIKIAYTGIRPGEKLFEELLSIEEGTTITRNDRIYMNQRALVDPARLNNGLFRFERLIATGEASPEAIRAELAEIVPGYRFEKKGEMPVPLQAAGEVSVAVET